MAPTMDKTSTTVRAASLAAAILLSLTPIVAAAESATPDNTARLLAGLPLPSGSQLTSFTQNRSWQRHAKHFDSAWARLEKRQLSKISVWSKEHIPQKEPVVYYMFSGPDFLYANAFFPDAKTYVLSALEPVGPIPSVEGMSSGRLIRELGELQRSVNSVLSYSFFITKKMRYQLRGGHLTGTLPVLYLFIARSGKAIEEVELVRLDDQGRLHAADEKIEGHADDGVKIVLTDPKVGRQTLYYFRTDLSNGGVKKSGFLKFCAGLGRGDSLIKSASYLLHSDYFSQVRDFLLEHSNALVQDDSGIPVRHFKAEDWDLYPFGNYLRPLGIFPGTYQSQLSALYRKHRAGPLEFGIGYRWRPRQSNLLLAVKNTPKTARGE